VQAPETGATGYVGPIQGGSLDLRGEGPSHGRTARSPLDCGAADGAASGTDHPEPDHGIQREGSERLREAIDKLKSLHDGDRGIIEIAACGRRAIPALRALLFEREPSGLYQPRCHAVKALAAFEAYDVLIEYLNAPRAIADPIERVGEDAVTNAAAHALEGLREERIFKLLMSLAKVHLLPGIIGALGRFGKVEAIPYLVEALAEDESRPAAEAALRNFGSSARQALLVATTQCSPPIGRESESSLRRRRSALQLLTEIGIQPETWPVLRHLMQDQDAKILVLVCKISLASAMESEKDAAIRCLISLLPSVDFVLTDEIEQCLTFHFDNVKKVVAAAIQAGDPAPHDDPPRRIG
jgi:hypothetical protein